MNKNFIILTVLLIILVYRTNAKVQTSLQFGEKDFFMNCNLSEQDIQQLTPRNLQESGGWSQGRWYPFLQNLGDQKTMYRIQLSDEEFQQGFNMQFDVPQVLVSNNSTYRPQLRQIISKFHKQYLECCFSGKKVTTIPSFSHAIITDKQFKNKDVMFKQFLNEKYIEGTIENIQELQDYQQSYYHILDEKSNEWPFLDDYQSIQGDINYKINKYFGYGKDNQSQLFKNYQEQYQELIYGKKLWILIPECWYATVKQKISFDNIIEFIQKGSLQISSFRVILQQPGEIIYIPDKWKAATFNIGEVLYISNVEQNKSVQQNQNNDYLVCSSQSILNLIEIMDQQNLYQQNLPDSPVKEKGNNLVHQNSIERENTQADYIQPKGNMDIEGSDEYHVQCNLKKQELIDLMDPKFKDNGGWDPNEIYDVLKNITYRTENVQTIELSDEEFLEGLDVDLDYPTIYKSKNHKYRPQTRDILHLFYKQYLQCSYSKRSVSLTPCFGEDDGVFMDVLFEDWLAQSEKEKYDVTMEELQELEGNQFYNLFGGSIWPFLEQNYDPIWKNNKDKIQKMLGYGKSGSGVPFHKHQDVLNEVIYGQKLWFLSPPCKSFQFNDKGMSIKFLNQQQFKQQGMVVLVQQPGEILYIPKFWYHSTLNIGETICVGNFNYIDFEKYKFLDTCQNENIKKQAQK